MHEGDNANSFYVVKEGIVSVIKNGKDLRKLTSGDFFGEKALYKQSIHAASVKADVSC